VELRPGLGARAGAEAEARGVFFRVVGDILAFCPPYVVTEEEIDHMVAVLGDSVAAAIGQAA
jgi:4-aminobutyrate--pyruvate transaminase